MYLILKNNNPYISQSFSNKNRLMRLAWLLTWGLLFRPTPRAMHGWRNILLKLFGAQIGDHVHIHGTTKIWAPWNLHIGSYVGVGENVNFYSMDLITIKDYVVVSQGTNLCCGSHDYNAPNFQLIAAPITIGERVWLCADSFVGPGVSIAEGSVVGARGLVSRSIIEPWAVWTGVPVKRVGNRNKVQGSL